MNFHFRSRSLGLSHSDEAREDRIAVLGRIVCSPSVSRVFRAHVAYLQRIEIRARSAEQIARMESALAARIAGHLEA
ncbi:hypothetical protein [Burkholderia gladioli]|uniref:hypothetical protein n=1 Tax=Burkholderia gladioli TaxID=28095 RepID=UPI0034DAD18E